MMIRALALSALLALTAVPALADDTAAEPAAAAPAVPGDPGGSPMSDTAVFEAFHGRAGIDRIVGDAVDRSAADPRIGELFRGVDLPKLKGHLSEQFCYLLGGGCAYTGRDMAASHKDMGATMADLNALVENLQWAMDKEGVPFRAQNKLLAKLAPMKKDVVTR